VKQTRMPESCGGSEQERNVLLGFEGCDSNCKFSAICDRDMENPSKNHIVVFKPIFKLFAEAG